MEKKLLSQAQEIWVPSSLIFLMSCLLGGMWVVPSVGGCSVGVTTASGGKTVQALEDSSFTNSRSSTAIYPLVPSPFSASMIIWSRFRICKRL